MYLANNFTTKNVNNSSFAKIEDHLKNRHDTSTRVGTLENIDSQSDEYHPARMTAHEQQLFRLENQEKPSGTGFQYKFPSQKIRSHLYDSSPIANTNLLIMEPATAFRSKHNVHKTITQSMKTYNFNKAFWASTPQKSTIIIDKSKFLKEENSQV